MSQHFFLTIILSLCLGQISLAQCDDLVLISPLDLEFCEGDEITLNAESIEGGTITWSEGENGVPFFLGDYTGTHTFTAESSLEGDCPLIVEIEINESPVVAVIISEVFGCTPMENEFSAFDGGDIVSYEWTFGDGETGTGMDATHIYEDAGSFDIGFVGTDAAGCSATLFYESYVLVLDGPTVGITADATEIYLGDEVTLTATGAATYTWDPEAITSGTPFEPAELGEHVYTVTGATIEGCSNEASITITVLEAVEDELELTFTVTNEDLGTDGAIDMTIIGGIPPYTVDWDNDGTGDFDDAVDLTGLIGGTYNVVVRDAAENEVEAVVIVESAVIVDELELTFTVTNEDLGADGAIDMTITGGTPPYTVDWDNDGTGDFDDPVDLIGLIGGSYSVIVKDAADNEEEALVIVGGAVTEDEIVLTFIVANEDLGSDGAIDMTITGGTPPYTVDWDNDGTGDFDDTVDLIGLTGGMYTVVVKDALGAEATQMITISSHLAIKEQTIESITIYPNPSSDIARINLGNNLNGYHIVLTNMQGKQVYKEDFFLENELVLNTGELNAGVFILTVVEVKSQAIINLRLVVE